MRFTEFLPDLSLAFILWTIIIAILGSVLWLTIYAFFKIIPKSIIPIRLEHILFLLIFVALPLFIKRTFYSKFSISAFIGLSRSTILIIGFVLVIAAVWFGRKHIGKIIDKALYGLDSRITPLVWLFVFLFALAVPLSFFKKTPPEMELIKNSSASNNSHVNVNNTNHPNIILVVMDSLTSLDMQLYGYERPTTPFISEWAKDAIIYNNVYSSSNWTTPSVMSLMTGQRVWTHRIWNDVFYRPVNYYENSFPKVLKDHGYDVYGFVQNRYAHPYTLGIQDAFSKKDKYYTFWISQDFWFNKFMDSLLLDRPIVYVWIMSSFINTQIMDYFRPPYYTTPAPPEKVFNSFLDYISQEQHRKSQHPFFALLYLWSPHFDYLPPKPYMGLFGDKEKFNSNVKQWSNFVFNKEYTPDKQRDVDILRKRYDEFILYCDNQFGMFISQLANVIDISNTIIIFTSDHGESFADGFLAHAGPHLYRQLVNVPLIIKIPGETKGKRIDTPVEQIDIAPTILELAGIHVPQWMEGQSLLPLHEGKTLEPHPIYSMQFRRNRSLGHPITKGTVAVWDGDYKLIYYLEDKKSLLFNLKSDPDETNDITKDKPEISQRLKKLIIANLSIANQKITQNNLK